MQTWTSSLTACDGEKTAATIGPRRFREGGLLSGLINPLLPWVGCIYPSAHLLSTRRNPFHLVPLLLLPSA